MEQFFYLRKFIDELNDSLHDIISVMNESQHNNDIINNQLNKFKRNKEFIKLSGNAISEIENFSLTKNQEHIDRFMKIFDISLNSLDTSFFFINQKLVDSNNQTGINYLSRGYMNFKSVNLTINSLFGINQNQTPDKSKEFTNPLIVNPIAKIEKFINRYWNFLREIKGLLDSETQHNHSQFIKKASFSYVFYINKDNLYLDRHHEVMQILTGFSLNANDRQTNIFNNKFSQTFEIIENTIFEIKRTLQNIDLDGLNYFNHKVFPIENLCEKSKQYMSFNSESSFTNKKTSLIQSPKDDNTTKEPIYPETELKVEFNPQIFKDEYSSRLFCYLIDSRHNGKDVELSNIYQWMENKELIHQNRRQEYKDFVKSNNITKNKYSRVHSSTEYNVKSNKLDTTFNELQKRFDRETK